MGKGRAVGIWLFGMAASGIAGGLIAMATVRAPFHPPTDDMFGLGFIAGVSAFACLRLWLVPSPQEAQRPEEEKQSPPAKAGSRIGDTARLFGGLVIFLELVALATAWHGITPRKFGSPVTSGGVDFSAESTAAPTP